MKINEHLLKIAVKNAVKELLAKNNKTEELFQIYLKLEKEKSKIYDPEELKKIQKQIDEAYAEYDKIDREENKKLDELLKQKKSKL